MDLSLEFCVRSISPIPLEGFSLNFGHMFASVRRCAELITQPILGHLESKTRSPVKSKEKLVNSLKVIFM